MQKLLNLGCGSRYLVDSAWSNVDFKSNTKAVLAYDLTRGIPFSDCTFDVIYHSHVLEHFSSHDAVRFMRECFRVLKPGGTCRVVVPDMEAICRQYMEALGGALRGEEQAFGRYQWMLIEMLDQLVRHRSGGEMASYLQKKDIPERQFIICRIGDVAKEQLDALEYSSAKVSYTRPELVRRAWIFATRKLSIFRLAMLSLVLNRHEMQALELGLFRLGGESHLWMYDRYSLREVMHLVGFDKIEQCTAISSRVIGWDLYCLDTEKDGSIYKPDSLYMEALRPD